MTSVRRALPPEAGAVKELVERAYAKYVPRIGRRPAPMDADYRELIALGRVSVVEAVGGQLVGAIVLVEKPDHLLIENVAVDPESQGRGIGRALLEFAEREARARGLAELRLYTHERMTENIAYYPRRGYVETHRSDDGTFHRVHFAKRLAAAPSAE